MKKLLVLVSIVMAFVFSGCSNEPTPQKQEQMKKMNHAKQMDKMMSYNGKTLYEAKCHKTKMRFSTKAEAKKYIADNKMCKDLNDKGLNKVACHLTTNCKAKRCGSGKCGGGKCASVKKMPKKCGAGKCGGAKKCGS